MKPNILLKKVKAEKRFVLAMWVDFDRFVRTYLLEKGQTLKTTVSPTTLGDSMYQHFRQQIEYWRTEELLKKGRA
jgi:hypothetical protein